MNDTANEPVADDEIPLPQAVQTLERIAEQLALALNGQYVLPDEQIERIRARIMDNAQTVKK